MPKPPGELMGADRASPKSAAPVGLLHDVHDRPGESSPVDSIHLGLLGSWLVIHRS